jgi:trehalose 6-phosphate synthase/phosphatase
MSNRSPRGNSNPQTRRLLVVANRSPFTAIEENGEVRFSESAGGLVTGLTAYLSQVSGVGDQVSEKGRPETGTRYPAPDTRYLWVGWPGGTISASNRKHVKEVALKEHSSYPVFLSEEEMESFYQGFCNKTIWPLFHYFPSYTRYESEYWQVYKRVNSVFCAAVMEVMQPGDIIWVQDYQLMLLPRMIREQAPDARIGFFLHIPFPNFEIFRLLPKEWKTDILHGLLGADLVGFHTYDYTQYFLRSVLRVLGHEHSMGQIFVGDRVVKADTFPMGIDFDKFAQAVTEPKVVEARQALRTILGDATVILSIDRLDYSKGIINRLHGYEQFLDDNPKLRKKVVLALVVVPSRVGVELYDETKERIEATVGRINGRFGSIDWVPIRYQYRSVPFESLVALYSASHIGLVTPLRDGMNLIAKEYLAAREDDTGVLILSEMAGAAKELGEAIIINPNSKEEIAEAIKEAIEMPKEEQARRNRVMRERLRHYNVVYWVEEFMREWEGASETQDRYRARLLSAQARQTLTDGYREAARRTLFLDYDGTLMNFKTDPQAVVPTERVRDLLAGLGRDPRNDLYLVSGRDRETLQGWFADLGIGLIAEHGVWIMPSNPLRNADFGLPNGDEGRRTKDQGPRTNIHRLPTEDEGRIKSNPQSEIRIPQWEMLQPLSNDWKEKIRPVLERYADRLPNAFVEEKEFSLAWHYRAADPELAEARASELVAYLTSFTANIDVQVMQGHKVIEVKSAGINKGTAARHIMSRDEYDFILAIGDDWTDEYLFSALPEDAYSIRVGMAQTAARYNVRDIEQVLQLLEELVRAGTRKNRT